MITATQKAKPDPKPSLSKWATVIVSVESPVASHRCSQRSPTVSGFLPSGLLMKKKLCVCPLRRLWQQHPRSQGATNHLCSSNEGSSHNYARKYSVHVELLNCYCYSWPFLPSYVDSIFITKRFIWIRINFWPEVTQLKGYLPVGCHQF